MERSSQAKSFFGGMRISRRLMMAAGIAAINIPLLAVLFRRRLSPEASRLLHITITGPFDEERAFPVDSFASDEIQPKTVFVANRSPSTSVEFQFRVGPSLNPSRLSVVFSFRRENGSVLHKVESVANVRTVPPPPLPMFGKQFKRMPTMNSSVSVNVAPNMLDDAHEIEIDVNRLQA